MKFDINNIPTFPLENSEPDLDNERTYFLTALGCNVQIAPGDWVDVSEGGMTPDAEFGKSFQVSRTMENSICILHSIDGINYEETTLSPCWILNNYRRIS